MKKKKKKGLVLEEIRLLSSNLLLLLLFLSLLDIANCRYMEKEVKGNAVPEAVESKFRLRFWEAALASIVVFSFVVGLLSVYLTMPDSDYSFLKLPRSLEDLQVLR